MTDQKPKRAPTRGTRHGNGAGWGGPAKGPSIASKSIQNHPPYDADNPGHPSKWTATERRARREAQHEEHLDRLHKIAMGTVKAEPVVVKAMEVFRDSTVGPPKQTIKNYTGSLDDLPDDDLDAELARQRKKAAAAP